MSRFNVPSQADYDLHHQSETNGGTARLLQWEAMGADAKHTERPKRQQTRLAALCEMSDSRVLGMLGKTRAHS